MRYWAWGLGLILALTAQAETLTGRVINVHDGDTLTVRVGYRQVKVRLAAIDAPEHDQPFGLKAQNSLSKLALHRTVTVAVQKIDGYGRTVGTVIVAGTKVEEEQVRQGLAWVYRQYSHDPQLLALEAEAKAARRGLWADAKPIPPWEWRHGDRSQAPSAPRGVVSRCGTKHTCSDMTSCQEARFYLTRCGLSRLDGDKDGTPCEALCRSMPPPKATR